MVPRRCQELAGGVYGAYNVIPHASIVASSIYDFRYEYLEHRVGIRIRIWQGRQ